MLPDKAILDGEFAPLSNYGHMYFRQTYAMHDTPINVHLCQIRIVITINGFGSRYLKLRHIRASIIEAFKKYSCEVHMVEWAESICIMISHSLIFFPGLASKVLQVANLMSKNAS